jgi:putative spermidine/putrescine transport system substrate-binding protein
MVLGGTDILSAGLEQGLWLKLFPDHAAKFPKLMDNYLPQRRKMQELAKDQALAVVFMPAARCSNTTPTRSRQPPTTPQELLAWCKANPNKLIYARPANSGPAAPS